MLSTLAGAFEQFELYLSSSAKRRVPFGRNACRMACVGYRLASLVRARLLPAAARRNRYAARRREGDQNEAAASRVRHVATRVLVFPDCLIL